MQRAQEAELLQDQLAGLQDPQPRPRTSGALIPFLGFPATLTVLASAAAISYLQTQSCQGFEGQE